MRYVIFLIASVLLIAPVNAAVTPELDARASLDVVQRWIYNYRASMAGSFSLESAKALPCRA